MEKIIKAGTKTPEVVADIETGNILIKGVIIPENPVIFFSELEALLSECNKSSGSLRLNIDLEYFNTGAARYLYEMFKNLHNYQEAAVNWFYEPDDEDIYESGVEFRDLSGIDFNIIAKN